MPDSGSLLKNTALGIVPVSDSLSVLRSGATSEHATEMLGDERTARLFQRLRSEFDIILFDTPPVGVFPDATLVAEFADQTILVASQFKVSRSKFKYAAGLMNHTRAKVLGVVFNGISDVRAAVGFGACSRSHYALGYEKSATKYKAYYRKAAGS